MVDKSIYSYFKPVSINDWITSNQSLMKENEILRLDNKNLNIKILQRENTIANFSGINKDNDKMDIDKDLDRNI